MTEKNTEIKVEAYKQSIQVVEVSGVAIAGFNIEVKVEAYKQLV